MLDTIREFNNIDTVNGVNLSFERQRLSNCTLKIPVYKYVFRIYQPDPYMLPIRHSL